MCCRTSIYPLVPAIAYDTLYTGLFRPVNSPSTVGVNWAREIPEEKTLVVARFNGEALELTLKPAVSSYYEHIGKRIAAGVYFEIAARYAQKVGGEIIQQLSVNICRTDRGDEIKVASYPSQPLDFNHVCPGFQEVFLGEHRDE